MEYQAPTQEEIDKFPTADDITVVAVQNKEEA